MFEKEQKEHFNRIAPLYEAHYGDPFSIRYRHVFLEAPMFKGMDLRGLDVLDAMCSGNGPARYLRRYGARVTGLNISESAIRHFKGQWSDSAALCASILDSGFRDGVFDCVVVAGGLHHLHPHVEDGIREIYRILKPGGYFCFYEPHKGSAPDVVRRRWYRTDRYFAVNEAAIDLPALKRRFKGLFRFVTEEYGGNIAYLLVFNSMIFRIPLAWKRKYAPSLLRLEALLEKRQGKRLSCFVICMWRKTGWRAVREPP